MITYRGFQIYNATENKAWYRTSLDDKGPFPPIYMSMALAKEAIDDYYRGKASQRKLKKYQDYQKVETAKAQKLSTDSAIFNAKRKVKLMFLEKNPINVVVRVYYRDSHQKQRSIQIKRLRGKLFEYKHSNRKAVRIYYKDVFTRLVTIALKYDTGNWS